MSLVTKVILKNQKKLFINDGTHGHLSEIKKLGSIQPVRIFGKKKKEKVMPFSFYGPTCDSNDFMKGPFLLPDSINEGDFIELESMGAYSVTMKNNFNGFYSDINVFVDKENDYQINNKNNSSYNKIDSN